MGSPCTPKLLSKEKTLFREYLMSSQAPKDKALTQARELLAKERSKEAPVGGKNRTTAFAERKLALILSGEACEST